MDSDGRNRRRFIGSAAVMAGGLAFSAGGRARAKKLAPEYDIPDQPVTSEDWLELKMEAERVLGNNRVTTDIGTFHVPSKDEYTSLFGWDSGWHAIAMRWIDPAIAASEVQALMNIQEENGRVSHCTKVQDQDMKPGLKSAMAQAMGDSQYDEQGRSAMIDPPSYLIAAEKIFEISKDRDWLSRNLPRFEMCLDYLARERDLFGDGLVSVIHPWETGTDSSPAYDELLGLDFSTPLGAPKRGLLYPKLLDFNAEFDWDPQVARDKNRFVLEDMTFNSIVARANVAVANLFTQSGQTAKADKLMERARAMAAAMDRINWDDIDGLYFSRYDTHHPVLARRTTAASLMPMLTGLIPKDRAERLVKEHLLNPEEFWRDFVVTFNAKDELDAEKVYMEDLLLWRGHCIWININWMMVEGLMNYGYREIAREVTRRTAKMIRHEGFREFYDFRNGQGKGATNFNWPALILDMIARTWPEAMEQ